MSGACEAVASVAVIGILFMFSGIGGIFYGTMRSVVLGMVACFTGAIFFVCFALILTVASFGRDRYGHYAQKDPALHEWFESLRSGKGFCCADADGRSLINDQWEVRDGHYWVQVPSNLHAPLSSEPIWLEVPTDAVITEPNRAGRTIVWPVWNEQEQRMEIECFLPGSMS